MKVMKNSIFHGLKDEIAVSSTNVENPTVFVIKLALKSMFILK